MDSGPSKETRGNPAGMMSDPLSSIREGPSALYSRVDLMYVDASGAWQKVFQRQVIFSYEQHFCMLLPHHLQPSLSPVAALWEPEKQGGSKYENSSPHYLLQVGLGLHP